MRFGCIADKTAGGVRIKGEKKGNEKVVSVPEGFEGLLADTVVSCGIH